MYTYYVQLTNERTHLISSLPLLEDCEIAPAETVTHDSSFVLKNLIELKKNNQKMLNRRCSPRFKSRSKIRKETSQHKQATVLD